jgi:hypothetical protein
LRDTTDILMEGSSRGLDPGQARDAILERVP